MKKINTRLWLILIHDDTLNRRSSPSKILKKTIGI